MEFHKKMNENCNFFQEWRLCLRAKSSTASRKSTGFRECCSRCRFSSSTPSIGGRISIKRRRSLGPTSIRSSSDALPASRASDQFYLQLLHFFFSVNSGRIDIATNDVRAVLFDAGPLSFIRLLLSSTSSVCR